MPFVLVVDDRLSLAQGVAMLLRAKGYTTHCSESGEAALAFLADHSVDLIVLDLSMPGMSGLAVLRALHAPEGPEPPDAGPRPPPPVVVFSADAEHRDEALALGATDYVSKAYPLILIDTVTHHLPPNAA